MLHGSDCQNLGDDVANQCASAFRLGQLWRSCSNGVQTLTDRGNHVLDLIARGMSQGDQQSALAGVMGQAGDARQQQRTAGDRLAAGFRVCQAYVPTPPVVDQGNGTGGQMAAFQILGGVATPAPLIFQFVETILAIGSVSVQLADGPKV